jgi:2-methylisocitrate lyase-like PEP mutase family enzyme
MRALLEEKDYIVTPGVANPMHAMIVERVGFDYVYMTGYGTSLTILGLPDVGLLTETEMVTNAKNIAKAVNIPVIADADTGFGNAINMIRTVQDYEAADAVAAVGGGFEEALTRGKEFARAGADMVFCEFPSPDGEQPKRFAAEMHKEFPNLPLFFNYSSSFTWYDSPLKFSDVAKMGYKVIIISLGCLRVSIQAVWDYAADLMDRKEQAEKDFERKLKGHPTEDFNKFAGFPQVKQLEAKYLPDEEVRKKYEESIGFYR